MTPSDWACLATMAASGPAVNEKAKQCGYFDGGDERKLYSLPSGWEVDFQNQKVREKFEQCGWYSGKANMQDCCEQLGYDFIENNIGDLGLVSKAKYFILEYLVYFLVVLFFLILIIFLLKKRLVA